MKLIFNKSWKVIIPKSMVENTLHWKDGDELEVSCDGKQVVITKKEV
jgi:antitoxin component of MazEF toxin-antitoxin module